MSRKTDLLNQFEVLMIEIIKREGLVNSNSLLAHCVSRRFSAHIILLSEGRIQCQHFNHLISGWKSLVGEKKFNSMKEIEGKFIKEYQNSIRKELYENEYH